MTTMKDLPDVNDRMGFGVHKRPRTADWAGKRKGETIGGGCFVFRRGEKSGRIFISDMPYEHANPEEAAKEAHRLAEANPGNVYEVFRKQSKHVVIVK